MLVSLKGDTDMQEKIVSVLNEMAEYLSISQMKKLQEVIIRNFAENEAKKKEIIIMKRGTTDNYDKKGTGYSSH